MLRVEDPLEEEATSKTSGFSLKMIDSGSSQISASKGGVTDIRGVHRGSIGSSTWAFPGRRKSVIVS